MELNPDTSHIPRWRQPATRREAPIIAYRCWMVNRKIVSKKHMYYLSSVVSPTPWEGPVIRSDKRPLDPKVWDKAKREQGPIEASDVVQYVFSVAGIHALKTLDLAREAAVDYGAGAYGEVALWGRVVQFELGYRAEVCMVKKLYLRSMYQGIHPLSIIADSLGKTYACDCEIVNDSTDSTNRP